MKNFLVISAYLISCFVHSGRPEPSETMKRLDEFVLQEESDAEAIQQELEDEQDHARTMVRAQLWKKFGSLGESLRPMLQLIKPIVDNYGRGKCNGGQERLEQFMIFLAQLYELHESHPLGSKIRSEKLANFSDEVWCLVSEFDQALGETPFAISSLANLTEHQEEICRQLSTKTYTAWGANFTLGALVNFGLGLGVGLRRTFLGEKNCAGMLECVGSGGCCHVSAAKIRSQDASFSFTAGDQDQAAMHFGFLCVGGTNVAQDDIAVCELSPFPIFSLAKCGAGQFCNLSPKIVDIRQFQINLGLTLATSNQNIGRFEKRIATTKSIQELSLEMKNILRDIKNMS
jgi:hypothetical protein